MRSALCALSIGLAGCGDATRAVAVPDPDLRHQTEIAVVEALHRARDAVAATPRSAASWGKYADLLNVYGYEVDAANAYAAAMELEPKEFRWPYLHGLILALRDPATAYQSLQRALRLDPDYAVGQVKAGNLAIDLDRDSEAHDHFARALAIEPDSVEAELGMGRWAMGAGRWDEARSSLERALELDPNHPEVHEALSRLFFQTDDQERARLHADRARSLARKVVVDDPRGQPRIQPISSLDFLKYGLSLVSQGKLEESREKFQRAVELQPDLSEARYNLALSYASAGDLERAALEFGELLRRRPDHLESLLRLGVIEMQLGRIGEAKVALERLITLDPASAMGHYQLGQLYERTGRLPGALGYYAKAVESDPESTEFRAQWASALGKAGRNEEAAEQWGILHERAPQDLEFTQQWAGALARAGKSTESLAAWNAACALAPDDEGLLRSRQGSQRAAAAAAMNRGDESLAVELLDRLLAERPDWSPALRTLAWLYATSPSDARRDPSRALELAESAVEHQAREDAALLDTLAVALAANGRMEEAIEQAKRALKLAREGSEQSKRIAERIALYRDGKPFLSGTDASDDESSPSPR